jgi:beta-glucanase (GH16 family)
MEQITPLVQSRSMRIGRLAVVALLCVPLPARAQSGLNSQWIAFNRAGAPNSPSQCFTPNNVSVAGGDMVITTQLQTATCASIDFPTGTTVPYTSGYVAMRSFNFLYGTVEFRAKFGGGASSGSWPVVWMEDASCQASDPTGTDDSCNGQEIDIAEILGGSFTQVNEQIHVNNFAYNDQCTAAATDTSQNFHVYQLIWSPGSLVFTIDGATTCTITRSYVPNAAMYLKVGAFVGGFGGAVNNGSLPWTTLVDYVKVTQGSSVVFSDDFGGAPGAPSAPANLRIVVP